MLLLLRNAFIVLSNNYYLYLILIIQTNTKETANKQQFSLIHPFMGGEEGVEY